MSFHWLCPNSLHRVLLSSTKYFAQDLFLKHSDCSSGEVFVKKIFERKEKKLVKRFCGDFLFSKIYIFVYFILFFFCYLVIKIGTHFEFLRQGLVDGYRQQVLFIIITKGGGGLYHRSTRM